MDPAQLRAEFPVLREVAYLNAGTCGPLPRASSAAAAGVVHQAEQHGRTHDHFVATGHTQDARRRRYAALVGGEPEDVALTTATSEGMVRVLQGLEWHAGDEVLTAEQEHPGLLGPLAALARQHDVRIRTVPLERIVEAVDERTRLVACSHVRWTDGTLAPSALAELRDEVPVLIDGAQGAGAIPVDVAALGCAFYAAAGQKWLCGPIGTGFLWIDPAWQARLRAPGPTYLNLSDPAAGLAARPWPDARAHDAVTTSGEAAAAALAAFDVLDEHGWPALHERAADLAQQLADGLAARGRTVAPRGRTTLVAWSEADPAATVAALAAAGVVVRDLPGSDRVRASVGAWNDEQDLDRLLRALD
ncbi:putative cysteine desulfurase [Patulibacter medicamentivorans]|uniref:Putative cysteine desulfurase n=1 Tax=Patulibacter medicamentivorans TaxID=1097667 RepID=H0E7Q3_9ACTN|nr:aminotransferase class V-fold PLP-dependent enzyme [Patulibacter medicamentivorans]EHN10327.1 putative cysteine desulfurase [Patulibacter medicamentivorans]